MLKTALRSGFFMLVVASGLSSGWAVERDVDLPGHVDEIYGQLLIVGFSGTKPDDPGVIQASEDLQHKRVGGLVVFEHNIVDEPQLAALLAHLRNIPSDQPPFLALDEEGGRVQRLARLEGVRRERSARWVGDNISPEEAQVLYAEMAGRIAGLGFNLNLAPVVDLDRGVQNPVIGRLRRSFASDPDAVARYAGAFIEAHRTHNVLTALKHWPGHGSSVTDPHVAVADVTDTWDASEREPFAALLKAAQVDMIMTGHVHHRDWGEGDGRPASLSPSAVQLALRQKLGFDGVVVTDDIQMEAALAGRSLAEAIVLALAAGNDMVLIANMLMQQPDVARYGIDAIKDAVADGRLDGESLKASYRRIVSLKQRLER